MLTSASGEQLRARRREGDESPWTRASEPAAFDCEFEARAVLSRAAAVTEQERLVDFLDVDAALNGLDRVGDLDDPARRAWPAGSCSRGQLLFLDRNKCRLADFNELGSPGS